MSDPEIDAIAAVNAALSAVEDPEARARVLRWANERFGFAGSERAAPISMVPTVATAPVSVGGTKEIPGIARLSENGEFRLTLRDVKASSANDAAVRLAHIAIRAYQQLTGQRTASSKDVVLPVLKGWRVYDGNTRATLAKQKGIIRNGDELDLDIHAQNDADRFVREALDGNIEGTWKPGNRPKRQASEKE